MDRLKHQAALSFKVNVVGTENVVRACKEAGVKVFVQTSTSNVNVSFGTCSMDMDEKVPYTTQENSCNHYSWTKAISEQIVLKADSEDGMRTGSIRPCSAVFGAKDGVLLEPFLNLGRAILPPNGGSGVLDFIPANNVVFAHLLLEKALTEKPNVVGGEAFCVSNSAPMSMRSFLAIVDRIRPGGVTAIPTPELMLTGLAYVVEGLNVLRVPLPRAIEPLTGCVMEYLNLHYAFNYRKAKDLLGYRPLYTVEQGVDLAVREWSAGKMLP